MENFPFVLKLHLFRCVAVLAESANLWKQVIRNLVRKCAAFDVLTLQDIAARSYISFWLDAGTAYGLIGGSVERFDRGQAVDGVDCYQRDDGGAVRIGDDTLMGERILRVDFRNHQWNLWIHTGRHWNYRCKPHRTP